MTFHPDHMHAGIQAAIKSPKTPKHLIPHLEQRMKKVKGQPITGAKTEMTFGTGGSGQGGPKAQSQIKAAPAPFANPQGVLQAVGTNTTSGKETTSGGKSNHGKSKFYGGK